MFTLTLGTDRDTRACVRAPSLHSASYISTVCAQHAPSLSVMCVERHGMGETAQKHDNLFRPRSLACRIVAHVLYMYFHDTTTTAAVVPELLGVRAPKPCVCVADQ